MPTNQSQRHSSSLNQHKKAISEPVKKPEPITKSKPVTKTVESRSEKLAKQTAGSEEIW